MLDHICSVLELFIGDKTNELADIDTDGAAKVVHVVWAVVKAWFIR